MEPKVSICIPTYKQTKYLQKCLDSVLMQDFKDYELIISDDTPDTTVIDFVKSVLKDKPYLYIHNKPSLGMPQNWNMALSKASGKYIKVLHHDDFFTQANSLRWMVETIELEKSDFLFCETDVWFTNDNTHKINKCTTKQYQNISLNPSLVFYRNLIGAPSATLYKNDKSVLYDERFKWLVDVEFYIRFLKTHKKITCLQSPLVCTAHGVEGQMTVSVEFDRSLQLREHVWLHAMINSYDEKMKLFFDYLFSFHELKTYDELVGIVPEAKQSENFYREVIIGIKKDRFIKDLKKRFYKSRLNFSKEGQFL